MSRKIPYAIIGAGPMGLCTARRLEEQDIPWIGFELHSGVGGLWDIDNPHSTMYETAHLISSKHKTEFEDFPMAPSTPDYPSHSQLKDYFVRYAEHFGLLDGFQFNSKVIEVVPIENHWLIRVEKEGKINEYLCAGVLLASGTLHTPNFINLVNRDSYQTSSDTSANHFNGELIHSAEYKSPKQLTGKRVLIIGCGNSACDIAIDAVHHAKSVDISVRRGYYFLPKYVAGKPIDTLGGLINLPIRIKQLVDGLIIKALLGKPSKYGLPDPDYKLYESHPVINSLILHHLGHGDIEPQSSIQSVDGSFITFSDGKTKEYDLIIQATGYKLNYPYIDKEYLNWNNAAPDLFLNVFNPHHPNILTLGMIEAAGLGWQGRDEQAKLVAKYLLHQMNDTPTYHRFLQRAEEELDNKCSGGINYLKLDRMAYYVHKETYLKALKSYAQTLEVYESDRYSRLKTS